MTNTSLKSLIETIEQKETMYKQHAEAIKTNILYVCDHFKNKFSLSVDSDIFYKSDFRDDMNYSLCLRTSYINGFEIVKCFDDGDIRYIPLTDVSTKIIYIIFDENVIGKLLELYCSEISSIESMYSDVSSRSQKFFFEIVK